MNFLLSTILFGLSALFMIAIAQIVTSVTSVRTVRQPVRIND